jgi:glycosyltransferase involved in cell wall biosynthesis
MEIFYNHLYKLPFFDIIAYLSLKEIYYPIRSRSKLSLSSIIFYKNIVRKVISRSDMILPNSHLELQKIQEELGVTNRYKIVPNAADIVKLPIVTKENLIVSVGRIEPRKNQLQIIKAFLNIKDNLPKGTQLLFIGALNQSHNRYIDEFLKLTALHSDCIKHTGTVPHKEVMNYFNKSKLLVLASYFETTGLVGLEAISCNANAVITDRGYTKEVFSDTVVFCNPYSLASLSEAMLKGFFSELQKEKINDLLKIYNWKNTAELTYKAYREVLGVKSNHTFNYL